MVAYNPRVLEDHAARLYARAGGVVASHGVVGFLIGGAGGFAAAHFSDARLAGSGALAAAVVLAVIGMAGGIIVGKEKAFGLKLQAQTALCQAQIEQNTRDLLAGTAGPAAE